MHRKFVSLYEALTGKKHDTVERMFQQIYVREEEKEESAAPKTDEEVIPISLEPELLPEVEIVPPPAEEQEGYALQEAVVDKEVEPEHEMVVEEAVKCHHEEEVQPHLVSEVGRELYQKSEEILSEERERAYIREKIEGRKKIVEGEEDIRRKIVVSIEVEGGPQEMNGRAREVSDRGEMRKSSPEIGESEGKSTVEKFKMISMEKEKTASEMEDSVERESKRLYEAKGSRIFLHEIIERIRSDIIARAESDARRIVTEAERRAREIVDNAYRESERIINEAITRTLDISRDIEKEAEERGYKSGFEKGYEEGKSRGYEDAYKKTLSEGRYALEMFRKLQDEITYAKERFSEDFPKIVIHLTLVALKTILMTDFLKDEELIVRTMRDAFEKVKDFRIVKIKINPSDLEIIRRFFRIPSDIDVVPDPSVEKGDVKIEMREGYFESSIRWREKVIEDTLKEELENLMRKKEEQETGKRIHPHRQEIEDKVREEVSKTLGTD